MKQMSILIFHLSCPGGSPDHIGVLWSWEYGPLPRSSRRYWHIATSPLTKLHSAVHLVLSKWIPFMETSFITYPKWLNSKQRERPAATPSLEHSFYKMSCLRQIMFQHLRLLLYFSAGAQGAGSWWRALICSICNKKTHPFSFGTLFFFFFIHFISTSLAPSLYSTISHILPHLPV